MVRIVAHRPLPCWPSHDVEVIQSYPGWQRRCDSRVARARNRDPRTRRSRRASGRRCTRALGQIHGLGDTVIIRLLEHGSRGGSSRSCLWGGSSTMSGGIDYLADEQRLGLAVAVGSDTWRPAHGAGLDPSTTGSRRAATPATAPQTQRGDLGRTPVASISTADLQRINRGVEAGPRSARPSSRPLSAISDEHVHGALDDHDARLAMAVERATAVAWSAGVGIEADVQPAEAGVTLRIVPSRPARRGGREGRSRPYSRCAPGRGGRARLPRARRRHRPPRSPRPRARTATP